MRLLGILAVIGGLAQGVQAHPLDLGYLRVTQTAATVSITLDLDAGAAAILLHVPAIDPAAARAGAATLANATYALAPITTAAGPCTWGAATAELVARTVTIASTATCPAAGERRWTFPFVHDHKISARFELLVKEATGGSERLTLVDASQSSIVLAAAVASATAKSSRAPWLVISMLGLCAICAILRRWLRRTTSTT